MSGKSELNDRVPAGCAVAAAVAVALLALIGLVAIVIVGWEAVR